MAYVERNLLKGEEIVYRASIHWAIFIPSVFWVLVSLAFLIVYYNNQDDSSILFFVFFPLFIAVFCFFVELIEKLSSEYVLTNKRLIMKSGFIARSTMELMLVKCEGISVEQSILGRILGYGTIWATTGGARNKYRKISAPVEFRNRINEQTDLAHSTNNEIR